MVMNAYFIIMEPSNINYVAEIIIIYKSKRKTQGLTQYNEIINLSVTSRNIMVIFWRDPVKPLNMSTRLKEKTMESIQTFISNENPPPMDKKEKGNVYNSHNLKEIYI
jgi:hypothetical protein